MWGGGITSLEREVQYRERRHVSRRSCEPLEYEGVWRALAHRNIGRERDRDRVVRVRERVALPDLHQTERVPVKGQRAGVRILAFKI